jgi:hypothetical protein
MNEAIDSVLSLYRFFGFHHNFYHLKLAQANEIIEQVGMHSITTVLT